MNEQGQTAKQKDDDPDNRGRRLALAVVVGAAAWWLVPLFLPVLNLDAAVQGVLDNVLPADSPLAGVAATCGLMLPYALLATLVYFHPQLERLAAPASGRAERAWRLVAAVLVLALLGLAWANRFLDDDAFISFRYARNLVEGQGLVYNPGERVEGYTNFLWVMLLAGGAELGLWPEVAAQAFGLALHAGTLGLTYRTGRRLLPAPIYALVGVVLLGTHYSVLSFATGGLETALQTFLLSAGFHTLVARHLDGRWRLRDCAAVSLIVGAGLLTRMDFAIFAAVLGLAAVTSMATRGEPGKQRGRASLAGHVAMLVVPAAVILIAWLAWKQHYYGALLPNTYFAKRPGPGAARIGLEYFAEFCRSYRYWPVLIVVLAGTVQLVRQRHILAAGIALIVAWVGYIVRMGGGFIEFRFLVPLMPVFLLGVVWTMTRFAPLRRTWLHILVFVWVAYGSLHHARTYGWAADRPEPVAHLRWQTRDALWAESGLRLNALFAGHDVVIATTVAGILPYYAGLTTIDMHGLTDAHIARHAPVVSNRPGHKRLADVEYLRRRRVNLVVGHPKIRSSALLDPLPPALLPSCLQAADPPATGVVVAMPITPGRVLLAWYLTPHPAIDRAIEERGWRVWMLPQPERPKQGSLQAP